MDPATESRRVNNLNQHPIGASGGMFAIKRFSNNSNGKIILNQYKVMEAKNINKKFMIIYNISDTIFKTVRKGILL